MTQTAAQKAATTRRIRSRARKWRNQYRPENDPTAPERKEQFRARVINRLDGVGCEQWTPDQLREAFSEHERHARGSFWRTVQDGQRECERNPHMRDYWRNQVMLQVRVLRQAPQCRAMIEEEIAAREGDRKAA